jgi:hypothetical protein
MLFPLWTLNSHHLIIINLDFLISLSDRIRKIIALVDLINDKIITLNFHLLLRRTHSSYFLNLLRSDGLLRALKYRSRIS